MRLIIKEKKLLWLFYSFFFLLLLSSRANAINHNVDSQTDFLTTLTNASSGDVIVLTQSFCDEINNTALTGITITLPTIDTRDITIDAEGRLMQPNALLAGKLFTVTHDGSGKLTFRNMKFDNLRDVGIETIGTGEMIFDSLSFDHSAKSAIRASSTSSVLVKNSQFQNGLYRAVEDTLSSAGHQFTIENCYFGFNSSAYGAAFHVNSNAIVVIDRCTFEENVNTFGHINSTGGAISSVDTNAIDLTIRESIFYKNRADGGGSTVGGAVGLLRIRNASKVVIEDCIFEGNKTLGDSNTSDGGAVAIKNNVPGSEATVRISGTHFIDNYSRDCGGAMLLEATNGGITETTLYNCTFAYNYAYASSATLAEGGAVQLYGTTNTSFFFNTFYKNEIRRGSGGGLSLASVPVPTQAPVITNNIFIDNECPGFGKRKNVYVRLGIPTAQNNGNIGYDNGQDFVIGDAARNAEVVSANIFKDFYQSGDALPAYAAAGDAKPVPFGNSVGSSGHSQTRSCYMITPLTDEMYRTNSRTVDTGIYADVRGFPREKIDPFDITFPYYPNAGAVEIYWTKFDPGTGNWDPGFDIAAQLGGIKSLITGSNAYYIVTNPPIITGGVSNYSSAYTFPRNTLNGPAGHGFTAWQDDKTLEMKDVNTIYYSRKQTYVAQWALGKFFVDFDLVGGSAINPADFATQTIIDGVGSNLASRPVSLPIKPGYIFEDWYESSIYAVSPWNFAVQAVTKDTTLYAKWRLDTSTPPPQPTYPIPTITPVPSGGPILHDPTPGINANQDHNIIILGDAIPTYTPSPPIIVEEVTEGTEGMPVTGQKVFWGYLFLGGCIITAIVIRFRKRNFLS